jgi:hypothetical protein
MYVRREAVLSSQIEGTQSTLDDVLAFEIDSDRSTLPPDVAKVVNYVKAMTYGLQRLETLPLSLRLLREIHGVLLADGRGSEKASGAFRQSQNWIGAPRLADAVYTPPPPHEMRTALGTSSGSCTTPAAWTRSSSAPSLMRSSRPSTRSLTETGGSADCSSPSCSAMPRYCSARCST